MDEAKKKKHKDDKTANSEGSAKSEKTGKSQKIHIEIAVGNWKRLTSYIDAYNDSAERMTPKYKLADIVNMSLARYLDKRVK